jgi:hypothetical protein
VDEKTPVVMKFSCNRLVKKSLLNSHSIDILAYDGLGKVPTYADEGNRYTRAAKNTLIIKRSLQACDPEVKPLLHRLDAHPSHHKKGWQTILLDGLRNPRCLRIGFHQVCSVVQERLLWLCKDRVCIGGQQAGTSEALSGDFACEGVAMEHLELKRFRHTLSGMTICF